MFPHFKLNSVGVAVSLALAASGCSLGPKAIERTHGRYAQAVHRVEEEQFLANIVRLRYVEDSTIIAVTAIATQHEVSVGAEARPFFGTESVTGPVFRSFTNILPFLAIQGADRPTVSLSPMDDGEAVRQFLTPISADTLVFLSQSGWPASSILRIWVDRLNGVPNFVNSTRAMRDTPSDFLRFRYAADLIQIANDRELISLRVDPRLTELSSPFPADAVTAAAAVQAASEGLEFRKRDDGESWSLVRRDPRLILKVNPAGQNSPELAELIPLLNLKLGLDQYEVIIATGVPDPLRNPTEPSDDLKFAPRSTAQALFFLANGVEVPSAHISSGLVEVETDAIDPTEATRGIFHVHSVPAHHHKPPPSAYVAFRYRDHWFYIDDRDRESKATLLLMLRLRRLDFRRQTIGAVPALTLPIGR
jgi:hypothetical protein